MDMIPQMIIIMILLSHVGYIQYYTKTKVRWNVVANSMVGAQLAMYFYFMYAKGSNNRLQTNGITFMFYGGVVTYYFLFWVYYLLQWNKDRNK